MKYKCLLYFLCISNLFEQIWYNLLVISVVVLVGLIGVVGVSGVERIRVVAISKIITNENGIFKKTKNMVEEMTQLALCSLELLVIHQRKARILQKS